MSRSIMQWVQMAVHHDDRVPIEPLSYVTEAPEPGGPFDY